MAFLDSHLDVQHSPLTYLHLGIADEDINLTYQLNKTDIASHPTVLYPDHIACINSFFRIIHLT